MTGNPAAVDATAGASPFDSLRDPGLLVLIAAAIVALTVTFMVRFWPHGSAQAAVTLPPQFSSAASPTGAQLESRSVLRTLAGRVSWRGSLGSLRERLFVVQSANDPSIDLVAQAGSAETAQRLANAWATIAARVGARNVRRFFTVRESFERSVGGWVSYNGGRGAYPKLSRRRARAGLESGRYALQVVAPNPGEASRSKYVWTQKILPVTRGDRFSIRAFVTGRASRTRPISLGVRITPALGTTQIGITPVGHGIVKTNRAKSWLMQGVYTVPRGVTGIQPALWKDAIPPRVTARFAVDEVALLPLRLKGNHVLVAHGAVRVGQRARSYALGLGAGLASAFLLVVLAGLLRQNLTPPRS